MITFLKLYGIALPVLLLIDSVWLIFVAPKFYKAHIGFLMAEQPNLIAALIFYLIFIVGLVLLVIEPSLLKHSLISAVLMGALFGLATYSTYDLTNLATVKNWPLIVTLVDLLWGTSLSATVTCVTYLIATKLGL